MPTALRIVRLAGLHYPGCMRNLLELHPEFSSFPYETQQSLLFKQSYTYSDSFSWGMRMLGHEAHEIVYDCEPMQKAWAAQHGFKYRKEYWSQDIALQQIQWLRPDVLYLQDIHALPHAVRNDLKQRFPFLKLVVIFRGYPGWQDSLAQHLGKADLLLLGSPLLKEHCDRRGLEAHLIYHAFDERLADQAGSLKNPLYPFTFLGSSGYGYGQDHASRYIYLKTLLEASDMALWVDEQESLYSWRDWHIAFKEKIASFTSFLPAPCLRLAAHQSVSPEILRRLCRRALEKKRQPRRNMLPLKKLFPKKCHPAAYGIEMYRILGQSQITFNKHANAAGNTVDNMRLFQATGMGSCLLTDWGKNILQLFEPDHEVVAYKNLEECLEKLEYLSTHEPVRREIARKGKLRTLRDHTVSVRCRQIHELIEKKMR